MQYIQKLSCMKQPIQNNSINTLYRIYKQDGAIIAENIKEENLGEFGFEIDDNGTNEGKDYYKKNLNYKKKPIEEIGLSYEQTSELLKNEILFVEDLLGRKRAELISMQGVD